MSQCPFSPSAFVNCCWPFPSPVNLERVRGSPGRLNRLGLVGRFTRPQSDSLTCVSSPSNHNNSSKRWTTTKKKTACGRKREIFEPGNRIPIIVSRENEGVWPPMISARKSLLSHHHGHPTIQSTTTSNTIIIPLTPRGKRNCRNIPLSSWDLPPSWTTVDNRRHPPGTPP